MKCRKCGAVDWQTVGQLTYCAQCGAPIGYEPLPVNKPRERAWYEKYVEYMTLQRANIFSHDVAEASGFKPEEVKGKYFLHQNPEWHDFFHGGMLNAPHEEEIECLMPNDEWRKIVAVFILDIRAFCYVLVDSI